MHRVLVPNSDARLQQERGRYVPLCVIRKGKRRVYAPVMRLDNNPWHVPDCQLVPLQCAHDTYCPN